MIIKFEVGETYEGRFICDSESKFKFNVVRRTSKSVWLVNINSLEEGTIRSLVQLQEDEEIASPYGIYSMSPILRASKNINRGRG